MRSLVVYYTRTGNTKKVAEMLQAKLEGDIEEIVDTKKRAGILGWLGAGKDGAKGIETTIREIKNDPGEYDLVVIGTPVWAGGMAAAIRTYITQNKDKFDRTALFCTCSGTAGGKTLPDMITLCGVVPLGQDWFRDKTIESEEAQEKVDKLVRRIQEVWS